MHEEISEAIYELNLIIYKSCQNNIVGFEYKSNGDYIAVYFMGQRIWNSADDTREFDESKNEYISYKSYFIEEANKILSILKSINLLENEECKDEIDLGLPMFTNKKTIIKINNYICVALTKEVGKDFRENALEPYFDYRYKEITIDFDGMHFGYPSSFLKEVFGGLSKKYGKKKVKKTLKFISNDEPLLIEEIMRYIDEE